MMNVGVGRWWKYNVPHGAVRSQYKHNDLRFDILMDTTASVITQEQTHDVMCGNQFIDFQKSFDLYYIDED